MTTTKKKEDGVSQGEVPSADENVEATDLDRKPVAVLPLHRAEDTVQRSATGRVDPRGKKAGRANQRAICMRRGRKMSK